MFDHQYMSYEKAHNPKLHPLYIRSTTERAMSRLSSFFEENGFVDIDRNNDFHEITGTKGPFEITFVLVPEENGVLRLSILAYTERKGGGAKRMVKALTEDIEEYFAEELKR